MAKLLIALMLAATVCLAVTCVTCTGHLHGPGEGGGRLDTGPDPYTDGPKTTDSGEVIPNPGRKTYYVRPKGGSRSQCSGQVNADHAGSKARACAFNHPFQLLAPGRSPLLKGGDTVVIANGTYRMGVGAPGAEGCSKAYPWDCHMPPIPSGTAAAPTRILGQGWNGGCGTSPQLYGAERSFVVLNLTGSDYVQLRCLDITDHSGCVEYHRGGLSCNRGSAPYGDWSATGLRASDSEGVYLKQVKIHGLAHHGVLAGRLKNWTLEDVSISGNGWVGWDGDLLSGSDSNSGKLTFRRVTIAYNGCAETYPGGKPVGCWGQSAGGYGDGLGTGATGGDWLFEDCRILHNTSDGLDLLYHSLGGSITIRRMRAEGNAGNQIKVTGNASVDNSVLVGNCSYFKGKSFTYNVDHCRALGNTVEAFFQQGKKISLTNNTIYGNGDVLLDVGVRQGYSCDGSESLVVVNNVFLGGVDHHQPAEKSALYYRQGCSGLNPAAGYNLAYNVKGSCTLGPQDLCKNPLLGPLSGDAYGMVPRTGSPAIDSGKRVGGVVPAVDFLGRKRPAGTGVDRGAYEVGAK